VSLAISRKEHHIAIEVFQELDRLFLPIIPTNPASVTENQLSQPKESTAHQPPQQSTPALVSQPDLVNNYSLMRILFNCHMGNKKQARSDLADFHRRLEEGAKYHMAPKAGVGIKISSTYPNKPSLAMVNVAGSIAVDGIVLSVPVAVLPSRQMTPFVFLLSGILWKAHEPSKAVSFLKEGIKLMQGIFDLGLAR
jgi:hypothetical protein